MMRWGVLCALIMALAVPALGDADADVVVRALHDELDRNQRELSLPDMPRPYYIAYTLFDLDSATTTAAAGAVTSDARQRIRALRVDLRVGGPDFDNGNVAGDPGAHVEGRLPLDDDYGALRHAAWLATDEAYKTALNTLERKRAEVEGLAATEQRPDFTLEPPIRHVRTEAATDPFPDPVERAALAARISATFREYPAILADSVTIDTGSGRTVFLASDGSLVSQPGTLLGIEIACRTQADDGMTLKNFWSFLAEWPVARPDEATLTATAHRLARELVEIRSAPVLDDYSGPVLFEGRAAAQLLRGFLAWPLSGTPAPKSRRADFQRMYTSPLTNKIGQRILPPGFRIEDNPLRNRYEGLPLVGSYQVDSEGVAAQRVPVVTNGVLATLLTSRTPRRTGERSNGHGRGGFSGQIRGAISNLILTAPTGGSQAQLRADLLAAVRASAQPYGLIVRLLDDVRTTGSDELSSPGSLGGALGGSAITLPRPLVVVKVDATGREEYVRGLVFEPQRLRSLKDIQAVGTQPAVDSFFAPAGPLAGVASFLPRHTQSLGAFSSSVVSPPLLLEEFDFKRATANFPRPPLFPSP